MQKLGPFTTNNTATGTCKQSSISSTLDLYDNEKEQQPSTSQSCITDIIPFPRQKKKDIFWLWDSQRAPWDDEGTN